MTIAVTFLHPRRSDLTYPADVNPMMTAEQALAVLSSPVTGPFLPPLQTGERDDIYLQRPGQVDLLIPPGMSMADFGIVSGDVLRVERGGTGALVIGAK